MWTLNPILLAYVPAGGGGGGTPVTFIRAGALQNFSGSGSGAHTFSVAPTVGNYVYIGICAWNGGSPATITATDNASPANTYTIVTQTTHTGSSVALLMAKIVNQPTTVTISTSTSTDSSWSWAEFRDVLGTSPTDQVATPVNGNPWGASPKTVGPTGTTAQAQELVLTVIGGNGNGTLGLSVPSGFTLLAVDQTTAYINYGFAYKIVGATGTQSATWPYTASWGGEGGAVLATFKAIP